MVFIELHSIHHIGVPCNKYYCCHDRHRYSYRENDDVWKLYNLIADQYGLDYKESPFDEALHTGLEINESTLRF